MEKIGRFLIANALLLLNYVFSHPFLESAHNRCNSLPKTKFELSFHFHSNNYPNILFLISYGDSTVRKTKKLTTLNYNVPFASIVDLR